MDKTTIDVRDIEAYALPALGPRSGEGAKQQKINFQVHPTIAAATRRNPVPMVVSRTAASRPVLELQPQGRALRARRLLVSVARGFLRLCDRQIVRMRERDALMNMDDRMLSDIGLTRFDVIRKTR